MFSALFVLGIHLKRAWIVRPTTLVRIVLPLLSSEMREDSVVFEACARLLGSSGDLEGGCAVQKGA